MEPELELEQKPEREERERERERVPLLLAQPSRVRGLFESSTSFLTNHSDAILRISHGTVWLIVLALAVEHRLLTFNKTLEYLLPSALTLFANTSMSMTYGFALRRRLIEQKKALKTLKGQLKALQDKAENVNEIIKNLEKFSTVEKVRAWKHSFKEILDSVENKRDIIPELRRKVEDAASWKVLFPGIAFLVFTVFQIVYHTIDLSEKLDIWSDLIVPGLTFAAGLVAISLYMWSYKRTLNNVSAQLPDFHADQGQLANLSITILKEISLRPPSRIVGTAEEKEEEKVQSISLT